LKVRVARLDEVIAGEVLPDVKPFPLVVSELDFGDFAAQRVHQRLIGDFELGAETVVHPKSGRRDGLLRADILPLSSGGELGGVD